MNKNINILITCVGGALMPDLLLKVKKSKKYNIKIIGTDENENVSGKFFCDYFEVVPKGSDKIKYLNSILHLINKYHIDIIIPTSDEEALTLSEKKKRIEEKNCIVAVDDFLKIKVLDNKIDTMSFLDNNQINKVFWKKINSLQNVINTINENSNNYDSFIVKPANLRGSRNIFKIDNKMDVFSKPTNKRISFNEFKKIFCKELQFTPFLIMEELSGPAFDVDILTWKGKLIRCIQRMRINADFPYNGYKLKRKKSISDLCAKVVETMSLSWLYDCDIMLDKFDIPHLIELNPRQSGSVTISLSAGINLIDNIIDLRIGKQVNRLDYKEGGFFVPYTTLKKLK